LHEIKHVFSELLLSGVLEDVRFVAPRTELRHDTRGFVSNVDGPVEVYILEQGCSLPQ